MRRHSKQGSSLQMPSLHLSNAAVFEVQQGQIGQRAHHCSPDLPRWRGAEGWADNRLLPGAGSPVAPQTSPAVKRAVQTQLAPPCPGEQPLLEGLSHPETGSAGGALQLAAVPACARDTHLHGMGVPEPACTHKSAAGKATTHSICTQDTSCLCEAAAVFRHWDRQDREERDTVRVSSIVACILLFMFCFQGSNHPALP